MSLAPARAAMNEYADTDTLDDCAEEILKRLVTLGSLLASATKSRMRT